MPKSFGFKQATTAAGHSPQVSITAPLRLLRGADQPGQ